MYFSLEDVDFAVADVEVVAHFVQFGGEPITFLRGLKCDLCLLLDQSILLLEPLAELFHLIIQVKSIDHGTSMKAGRALQFTWRARMFL